MPASLIGEWILQPILELVFHVVAYHVGCLVVPFISLGRWKCDPFLREISKKKLRAAGLYHKVGKQIYLTANGTSCIGLLVLGLVIGLGLWWYFNT